MSKDINALFLFSPFLLGGIKTTFVSIDTHLVACQFEFNSEMNFPRRWTIVLCDEKTVGGEENLRTIEKMLVHE
jgi:hypothetical protein